MITSAFNARSTALEIVQGHDLSDKTVVITGGASGIGLETARALLQGGAEVVLAVRNIEQGERVARELRQSTNNSRAIVLPLDLSSYASIRQAANQFLERWSALHILINNAGVMATPFKKTEEGFELQFGTNHLGHFLLSQLLLPALLAAAPARVVVLSSNGHRRSDIIWEDINFEKHPYDKWQAYGQSKTANALFALGFTKHYAAKEVTANAVNPGGIRTGLQKNLSYEEMAAMGWYDAEGKLNPIFKTPQQGAATSVWAGIGSELEGIGGLYLEDCQEAELWSASGPSYQGYRPYIRSAESAERLWRLSLEMTGLSS
jgi:NAD(P)-dependent dehydrogenase (short-subunit alcohol dehydrogenase family)